MLFHQHKVSSRLPVADSKIQVRIGNPYPTDTPTLTLPKSYPIPYPTPYPTVPVLKIQDRIGNRQLTLCCFLFHDYEKIEKAVCFSKFTERHTKIHSYERDKTTLMFYYTRRKNNTISYTLCHTPSFTSKYKP